MITNTGFSEITTEMVSLITDGVISSDSTDPTFTDTSISGELASVSVDSSQGTEKTFTTNVTIPTTTANGDTIRKTALLTSDGSLFSVDSHPDYAKVNTESVVYFHKITFKRGT